ncbi:hypothetical protein FUAX_01070 [Fulvitalea axinellae]|uniref:Putative NAD(P)H nitroreductase n=1 Tax=Fulvitalea axinellae TaxID=1182444 RepID=A0AAU9D9X9_9BACT|nr:hypothetical protein FUAX_01070 [Fulvitalea axinellae]
MAPEYIDEIIKKRRSIFPAMYTGETVSDEVVSKMIENAHWAPVHKRTYPWRFVVFKGDSLKELAEYQANIYKEKAEKAGDFDEAKYKMFLEKPLLASHIVAIGMKRDEKERVPEIEEVEAVACAVQNMYLTAAAHGVGVYWGTGGMTYSEEAKPFLNLGEKDKFLGYLFVGMPKSWPEGNRPDVADFVEWR